MPGVHESVIPPLAAPGRDDNTSLARHLLLMSVDPDSEILLETLRIGASMEVRAVSGGDGLEVSFVVPSGTGQSDIQRLARQKLAYVRKKAGGGDDPPKAPGRGGLIV